MKIFNLYGENWDETRDRVLMAVVDGRGRHRRIPRYGKVSATSVGDEPIMFARPGPTAEYWEGED